MSKFDLIMEDFYNGHEEGFHRWVDRQIQLGWFRPWLALSYLLTAVRNSVEKTEIHRFPNLLRWGNILWTLRWAWMSILEGDDFSKVWRKSRGKRWK